MHGGNQIIRHGMFSTIKRAELRELMEAHAANPDPLNLYPEVARLRALADDFINRYEERMAALLAWHESWKLGQRPIDEGSLLSVEVVLDELEALVGPADLDEDGDDSGAKVRKAMRDGRKLLEFLRASADDSKPRQMPDIADAYRIVDATGRMVKRIEDTRAQNAISRPEFFRVMGEMGRVVETFNDEPDPVRRLEKIREHWLNIRVA